MPSPYESAKARIAQWLKVVQDERQQLIRVRSSIADGLDALAREAQQILDLNPSRTEDGVEIAEGDKVDPITGVVSYFVRAARNSEHGTARVQIGVGDRVLTAEVSSEAELMMRATDRFGMNVPLVPRPSTRSIEDVLRILFENTSSGPHTNIFLPGSTSEGSVRVPLVDLIEQVIEDAGKRATSSTDRAQLRAYGQVMR